MNCATFESVTALILNMSFFYPLFVPPLLQNRGFKVNVAKTQCILFGTSEIEKEHITIDGKQVKISKTITYLGIKIDYRLLFREHISNLASKGKKAIQIMRYISGKKWGLRARVIKMMYLSYVLPK